MAISMHKRSNFLLLVAALAVASSYVGRNLLAVSDGIVHGQAPTAVDSRPSVDRNNSKSNGSKAKNPSEAISAKNPSEANTAANRLTITAEQEQLVHDFVRVNHPELENLLTYLQTNRPQEYKRAIRELHRNIARIESWRDKDAERYALELQLWQCQSRSQLLAARLTMLDEKQREEELRQLLRKQLSLRLELLQRERARVAERLTKLDEQIAELQATPEQLVEKQLQGLLRSSQNSRPAVRKDQSPAATKKAATPAENNKANSNNKTRTEKNTPQK
jgi:hypothetical protein